MFGLGVASCRVKRCDGFSTVRTVNFLSATFINVSTLLWVFAVSLQASSIGEIFCSCFAIQKYWLCCIQVSVIVFWLDTIRNSWKCVGQLLDKFNVLDAACVQIAGVSSLTHRFTVFPIDYRIEYVKMTLLFKTFFTLF